MRKRLFFRILGYLLCVLPPAAATLERFPVFARQGGRPVISGVAFLLLLCAAIPFRRGILKKIRAWLDSPSAYSVWLILWLAAEWLGRISNAVADIALISTVTSLLGAICFRLGREKKKDEGK